MKNIEARLSERKRRREKLNAHDYRTFKKVYSSYELKTDAQEAFGVSMQTLDRVLENGVGHTDTINKIRQALEL